MDRLELIREKVDQEINKLQKEETRKFAYIHTYGVAQAAALLATIRKADVELACIAAMLHDIALYTENCPHAVHAKRSSEYAEKLLNETKAFTEEEVQIIRNVIAVHSDKMSRHDGTISEILKDADVLQHYLYNVNIKLSEKDNYRLFYLLEALEKYRIKNKPVSYMISQILPRHVHMLYI